LEENLGWDYKTRRGEVKRTERERKIEYGFVRKRM
jgi:hypothetical protein